MSKTIVLIDNPENISELKKFSELKNIELFSLNHETHNKLKLEKLEHKIGDNFLSIKDRTFIDDFTINLTGNWYKHPLIKNHLIFENIELGLLVEQEFFQYFLSIIAEAIIIMKIIEIEKPSTIHTFTKLNDFVAKLCKKFDIELINHNQEKTFQLIFDKINIKFNVWKLPINFQISRSKYFFIKNLIEKIFFKIFDLGININKIQIKSILLSEFNPVQYNLLFEEVSKLDKQILLLNQRRSAIWNFKSFRTIKKSKCKILNLEILEKKFKNELENKLFLFLLDLDKMWLLDKAFEEIFSINSISLWSSISPSFKEICTSRFTESVKRIFLLTELFSIVDFSVILEWAESGQEEKELIFVGRKFGINSLMLQHAMNTTNNNWDKIDRFILSGFSYPFLSDKQILWGQIPKNQALKFPHNLESSLIVSGSPRHDKFFQKKSSTKTGNILLATTGVSGISYLDTTFDEYSKFENFIKEVYRVSKLFPDKHLIVKPHPRSELDNPITELIKTIDPNIEIKYNADLVDLINSCDLVITFNNSTIALESMILEKPTISLQFENWANNEDIVKMNGLISINKIEDVKPMMQKLLTNEKFIEITKLNGKKFIDQYFAHPGTASKTLAKILDSF